MLKLSQLLHGYFVSMKGNFQIRNRSGNSFFCYLRIEEYDNKNFVIFDCPLCDRTKIMLVFDTNGVYDCDHVEIDPVHLTICKECAELDFTTLDTWDKYESRYLNNIKRNFLLLGGI